jgi:Flp pilus assembly pilin Flp
MFQRFVKDNSGMVEWIIAVLIGVVAILSVPGSKGTATPFHGPADTTSHSVMR